MPETSRVIFKQARIIVGLLLLVAALVIGIVAIVTSSGTASCVNSALGDRAPITTSDNAALRKALTALEHLLSIDQSEASSAQQQDVADIKAQIHAANATLAADDALRRMKPLGRC